MKIYKISYYKVYLDKNLVDGKFRASNVLNYDCTRSEFLMVVYCIIYSAERNFEVKLLDNMIDTKRFVVKDFEIIKKD